MSDATTTEILLILLATSFGLWSLVVGISARSILRRVDGATNAFRTGFEKLDREINEYIRITETRLARLEEWQNHVNKNIDK